MSNETRVNKHLVRAAMMDDTETVWRFEVSITGRRDPLIVRATWPDMMNDKLPELQKQYRVLGTRVML